MHDRERRRATSEDDFGTPSRFWQHMGDAHRSLLDAEGPERLKRNQAFTYFTWSWTTNLLRTNAKLRRQVQFLLARTSPITWARALAAGADGTDADWSILGGYVLPPRDRRLYAFTCRLLWEYASRHDTMGCLRLSEPDEGDPLPVMWRGRRISQDLASSALEATAISRALAGRRPRTIVEIGAGYGRLAYALAGVLPDVEYTIVDIEPASELSRWYLTRVLPPGTVRWASPDELVHMPTGTFDLAVSISSLHEMTPEQVRRYLETLDRVTAGGIVFSKQWRKFVNEHDQVTMRFDEYPVPAGWKQLFVEGAPVQVDFRQAAWAVPGAEQSP